VSLLGFHIILVSFGSCGKIIMPINLKPLSIRSSCFFVPCFFRALSSDQSPIDPFHPSFFSVSVQTSFRFSFSRVFSSLILKYHGIFSAKQRRASIVFLTRDFYICFSIDLISMVSYIKPCSLLPRMLNFIVYLLLIY